MNQEDIIREIYTSDIIREIYTSDIILADMEAEMLAEVDDSYLNMMEEFHEYGFVQFKRGLEVGLSLRDIH